MSVIGPSLAILAGGGMNETAHTGAVDNVTTRMGYLKQLITDLRAFLAGSYNYIFGGEFVVTGTAIAVTGATTKTLLTVVGPAIITEVVGKITTVIQTTANNAKLICTNDGTSTDLCAVKDISADALGNWYTITGTFANALVENAVKVPIEGVQADGIRLAPGTNVIGLNTTAASCTGAIQWSFRIKPLSTGVTVTAA